MKRAVYGINGDGQFGLLRKYLLVTRLFLHFESAFQETIAEIANGVDENFLNAQISEGQRVRRGITGGRM